MAGQPREVGLVAALERRGAASVDVTLTHTKSLRRPSLFSFRGRDDARDLFRSIFPRQVVPLERVDWINILRGVLDLNFYSNSAQHAAAASKRLVARLAAHAPPVFSPREREERNQNERRTERIAELTPDGPGYGWYLDRVKATVETAVASATGEPAMLVAHSVGTETSAT